MNADMGFLTAMTIFIALVVDFFFLPPLLMTIDKKLSKKTQQQADDKNAQDMVSAG
jgi:hypothetical protein